MKASEIRQKFLHFFESKGHTIVPSSPVVPGDDPTLLFTNAGMNQFKDVFLGFEKRAYVRATSSQKCIRAGGKHNDLENVGYTARHHTFFEMLGNFSFGDYFKRDAISYAWELLTKVYQLPPEKLWVTVYAEDEEAYTLWRDFIGIPTERLVRIGDNKGSRYASDNFWMMGDTGPCGPCTEIFYDHGPEVPGGPPGSPTEDADRYIEIWNNVFMQFNRDESGVMHPLPRPSVDTGMGLERITAVLQHVHSNYQTDIFVALIEASRQEVEGAGAPSVDLQSASLKVIADHIRACSFMIVDGVVPDRAGRGYVLRRICRRAIRHGYKLGARQPFFHKLIDALCQQMGPAYPELLTKRQTIKDAIQKEEEAFFRTIELGMHMLESALSTLGSQNMLSGDVAFKLHDTFGFPVDLTADICRERGLKVDEERFETCLAVQRQKARETDQFERSSALEYLGKDTSFHGFDQLRFEDCEVTALFVAGKPVDRVQAGESAVIVLADTPFYAQSGGQVGDVGELRSSTALVCVEDVFKVQSQVFGHQVKVLQGVISIGEHLQAEVHTQRRLRVARNHSATHLLHYALKQVLGGHVEQKGSLVTDERTRFDFAHHAPVTREQKHQIETLVNAEILSNVATQTRIMPIAQAQTLGATMLFGEKYTENVRVLDIGSSRELCGGTHVQRTGDIGLFKIVSEAGVAAGIRRIEALTGDAAFVHVQQLESTLLEVASGLRATPTDVTQRLSQLMDQVRSLERECETLKGHRASSQVDDLVARAVDIQGVHVLAAQLDNADTKLLRETLDRVKSKLKTAVVVLASGQNGKVELVAGVTPPLTTRWSASELVNFVAQQVGGKGGGKADLAMAGGTQFAALPSALLSVESWVRSKQPV